MSFKYLVILMGKITIIKLLALSKIVYYYQVFLLPKYTTKKIICYLSFCGEVKETNLKDVTGK